MGSGARGEGEPPIENTSKPQTERPTKAEPPPALAPYISKLAVRAVLTMHLPELTEANFSGLTPDELRLYFTLTRSAEAPQVELALPARQVFEPQMVKIPAGKFLMGSTKEQAEQAIQMGAGKDWVEVEQPQHEVELSDYSIGKYPVTNREYQFFVKDGGQAPQGWDGDQYPPEKGDHPVVYVSWNDALAYCEWLGKKSGGKANYRLPTEAEWEKAARWKPSHLTSPKGRGGGESLIYPWGNAFGEKNANTAEAGLKDTSPVGQFSPKGDSPYGCVDMAGNVWEWCADWFDEKEYKNRAGKVVKDPHGSENGSARVLRGGAWYNYDFITRSSSRSRYIPTVTYANVGFRCALSK
jgi:formylglycine-generating enzyme required for sulfatase activity